MRREKLAPRGSGPYSQSFILEPKKTIKCCRIDVIHRGVHCTSSMVGPVVELPPAIEAVRGRPGFDSRTMQLILCGRPSPHFSFVSLFFFFCFCLSLSASALRRQHRNPCFSRHCRGLCHPNSGSRRSGFMQENSHKCPMSLLSFLHYSKFLTPVPLQSLLHLPGNHSTHTCKVKLPHFISYQLPTFYIEPTTHISNRPTAKP